MKLLLKTKSWRRAGDESGLTLIEILASMMVFMIVSAGVAGTLTSGLQASVHTRLQTIGKSMAQEQFEEMRSRVFHVAYSANPSTGSEADIDLLDRYYPGLGTSSSNGWTGWYTASGSFYTLESPADPDTGIITTVVTRFVNNAGQTIIPAATYDSNTANYDIPPSKLVSVSVTTSWADRTGENTYTLDSLISSTGQAVPGSADASGEDGASYNSNSTIDVIGGEGHTTVTLLGITLLDLETNAGEAHVSLQTGYDNEAEAQGRGGQLGLGALITDPVDIPLIGVDTGVVSVSSSQPPFDQLETASYPLTLSVPLLAATIDLFPGDATAEVSVQAAGTNLAEAETFVSGETVSISQLTGLLVVPQLSPIKQWVSINPLFQMTGGMQPQSSAYLLQEGATTTATASVHYDRIDFIPLAPMSSLLNTAPPGPDYGLVTIQNFHATVSADADGFAGNDLNDVTYSARVGLFDPTKDVGCDGEACYEWRIIDQDHPLQSEFNLNQSRFSLQKMLLTEFNSKTRNQIESAATIDINGNPSVFLEDGLLNIESKIGQQVNRNNNNGSTSMLGEIGLQSLKLGSFDVHVTQG